MRASLFSVALTSLLFSVGCSPSEPAAQPLSPIVASGPSTSVTPTPRSQPSAEPGPQNETPGLAVGQQAPAFELQDQHGQSQSLAKLLESGNVALVFYRSADW